LFEEADEKNELAACLLLGGDANLCPELSLPDCFGGKPPAPPLGIKGPITLLLLLLFSSLSVS